MSRRITHDILVHLLETSEVHFDEPRYGRIPHYIDDGMSRLIQTEIAQEPRLRRTLRWSEVQDFPVDIYKKLVELLDYMCRTGESVDVNRRFQRVRVTHLERCISPETFEYDFRIEFTVGNLDEDHWHHDSGPNYSTYEPVHDYKKHQNPYKSKVKKVEKHFEDDLFNL